MVGDHGTCYYDLRKEIEIIVNLLLWFSIVVLIMIKVIVILQVKAGKAMIKKSYSARWLHQVKLNNLIEFHIHIIQ